MKFKIDENLPASSSVILADAGHDVDTVADEELIGVPDQDVVAAATEARRILISLDRGLGDIPLPARQSWRHHCAPSSRSVSCHG